MVFYIPNVGCFNTEIAISFRKLYQEAICCEAACCAILQESSIRAFIFLRALSKASQQAVASSHINERTTAAESIILTGV